MFKKILIANRGEIACRVMKTAHRLGIACVAVFSEADRDALHVKLADEAYLIGPASSSESYLRYDVIIQTALKAGAEAIHPGYGFLSENPEFAEACAQASLVFIGPPVAAIRAMGSKSTAKSIMEKAKIPLVPGYHGDRQDLVTLEKEAEKIGYPVLLKAAAGGGGKGMRVVWQQHGFEAALESAKREAKASFGDDQILLEKYLIKPRHIEMQIFADNHGNVMHLFERDCSIQRRHQKIIEEAPAPLLSEELRRNISQAAMAAAKAIDYRGAGTIEFLLDSDGKFYFMEMNTRLQVEHPVTEKITQQDLVEWQLLVASGEKLPTSSVSCHGNAFEVRIYAENPLNDFLPSTGRINCWKTPAENRHIRIDTGVGQGDAITPFYDPLLAKLIVWDKTRELALLQLQAALAEFQICGVGNNLNLLTAIARHPDFAAEKISTDFIPNHFNELITLLEPSPRVLALAGIFCLLHNQELVKQQAARNQQVQSPWLLADNWRVNLTARQTFHFYLQNEIIVQVEQLVNQDPTDYRVIINDQTFNITHASLKDGELTAQIDAQEIKSNFFLDQTTLAILQDGWRYQLTLSSNRFYETKDTGTASRLTSPMPGKVVALLAKTNTEVESGTGLAVVEAMKMEHTIHAPTKGIVKEWYFQVGDLVDEGVELLKFETI